MEIVDKNTFFHTTQDFAFVPFTQSEGWRAYSSNDENRFMFFVDNAEKPSMACMGYIIRKFGLKMLQIEGECFFNEKEIDSKKIRDFYREISQTDFDIIEINSMLPYNALYEIGVREAGYLRPVGMFSSALSNWINLQNEIHYNENWRRNLKKAAKFSMKFEVIETPSEKEILFATDFYNKFTAQKGFAHRLNYAQTRGLLQSGNFSLALVKNESADVLAMLIFHKRRTHAGLLYAARNIDNRDDNGVTFFIYDNLFKHLKEKDFQTFDMEKLCPSTHSKQSVFLFKNGVRGEYVQYCGEFSFYKRHIYRLLMYFVKKYLFKRVEV
ncbi:MAG: hypothetical protein LBS07_03345 [Prevotellaceae bacterium]|jgi:hypothetical protein|nr:hypothetical protein [Prevotellaceae bacterium]